MRYFTAHGFVTQIELPTPVRDTQRHPIIGDAVRPTSVLGLIYSYNPFAVIGIVPFVNVDAFDGVTSHALPHIGKKQGVIKPSATDSNSAPTIIAESLVTRVRAPFYHPSPYSIGSGLRASMGLVVSGGSLNDGFYREAPTRFGVTVSQSTRSFMRRVSAVTQALPSEKFALRSDLFNRSKFAVFSTGYIDCFWHTLLRIKGALLDVWKVCEQADFSGATLSTGGV